MPSSNLEESREGNCRSSQETVRESPDHFDRGEALGDRREREDFTLQKEDHREVGKKIFFETIGTIKDVYHKH